MRIEITDVSGESKAEQYGEVYAGLLYKNEYQRGDCIHIEVEQINSYYAIQLDEVMGEACVFFTEKEYCYEIPFDEKKKPVSPNAFVGDTHYLYVRRLEHYEVEGYYNLCRNPYDDHENYGCFPHASANVETRGESVFAARNAIDGILENHSHGIWPYSSWGINRNPEAEMRIDFGRPVQTNRVEIWLRADFPHDSWWTSLDLEFSDGSECTVPLKKTDQGQEFIYGWKTIEWVRIKNLIKADDDSPFPALTQIKVYGKNL